MMTTFSAYIEHVEVASTPNFLSGSIVLRVLGSASAETSGLGVSEVKSLDYYPSILIRCR